MSKKRKVATRLIAVFIAAIILGSAVRVGMYYFEYRQDSKILHYLKENESKSVFRGLVNDDGKPYQQKTVRYDIDGDGYDEVITAKNFEVLILDGKTGNVKKRCSGG